MRLLFALSILLRASVSFAASPVIYHSDIINGPKSGGTPAGGGCIITVWGNNFGASQGSSTVSCCGAAANDYYVWSDNKLAFQIADSVSATTGQITVTVGGQTSNSVDFLPKASGSIYWVAPTGSNDDAGTWAAPWATIKYAKDTMTGGDICYIRGTLTESDEDGSLSAVINLYDQHTADDPAALVVYPPDYGGVTVDGTTNSLIGFNRWGGSGQSAAYWVISQFHVVVDELGIWGSDGYRVIGNYVTGVDATGSSGGIVLYGSYVKTLSNTFQDFGGPNTSKMTHGIYSSGIRPGSGPRLATRRDREIAWNVFRDCDANRAINIYNTGDYSPYLAAHNIHHNYIRDQKGDGILLSKFVVGHENYVWGNVIIRGGGGPQWVDGNAPHTGIYSHCFGTAEATTVYYYNNTLYDCGAAGLSESGAFYYDNSASHTAVFRNNIIYQNNSQPYHIGTSPANSDYTNLWYGNGSAPSWDTAAINSDPQLADYANDDVSIASSSPARDAGVDLRSIVTRDYDGVTRPQGSDMDIGAYEYGGSIPPVPPIPPPGQLSITSDARGTGGSNNKPTGAFQ